MWELPIFLSELPTFFFVAIVPILAFLALFLFIAVEGAAILLGLSLAFSELLDRSIGAWVRRPRL
jgi:hypothetical protein